MGTLRERASGAWELTVATGLDPATGKYGRVVRTVKAIRILPGVIEDYTDAFERNHISA